MRARYYNQDIKRFINRDVVRGEITNSGSLNRYCYVQGNPVSLTDPFGLCPDSNSAFRNLCNNLYHMDWSALGHAALDVAGIFFDGADVVNAIWYACEGNMEMAAVSAISAMAGASLLTKNLLMKGNKLTAAERAVKAVANLVYGTVGVCAGISMAKTGFTNFLNGLEAGTFDARALLQTLGGIGIALLSGKGMVSSGRELLACTGNSGKTMKGTLIDADISGAPIDNSDSLGIVDGKTPASRFADKLRTVPSAKRPSTVAVVRTADGRYYAGYNGAGIHNESIQNTLDNLGNSNQFNRKCAEVNALSRALNENADLNGATISISNVRGMNSKNGLHFEDFQKTRFYKGQDDNRMIILKEAQIIERRI